MSSKIFVNLPVKDLKRSVEFFTNLGYKFNAQFTDENATCMIVSEDIYVMLLVEKFFETFLTKPLADARKTTEVLVCLSLDSREEVDRIAAAAKAAGAGHHKDPDDRGFMYQRSFQDPDGHVWEYVWMDPATIQK
ncbi:MAG TPA: VOC family protein [Polyangiaceae bacterium]|nr:VOC family protein [Polyangiaceae bacterium]